ncbi:Fe-S cluster assembly protein SufD [Notoacmeibacter sp. MSK16QG-6]|uniref:Fe-S cluster assembly protein SufD n=1 Tax=Notoacmeibacter sp. MSK16QG-6 TaxID=2957982 RepID=UPI0020A00684|nr:Fe-S cluster assembly protein SufD [Notoacmeibacter sp. MSK16QG-6]MCP1197829.1 Fe-S cluster assembly protein SufD [Notoacmeibacter sp. MSK16QG-6]
MTAHTLIKNTQAESALIDAFAKSIDTLPGAATTTTARKTAIGGISTRGLPTRRVEEWHYTDLRNRLKTVPEGDARASGDALNALAEGIARIDLFDGNVPSDLPTGVQVTHLRDLLERGELDRSLAPADPEDVIGALNAAFVSHGAALTIDAGAKLDKPLELSASHGPGQAHLRVPVSVGADVEATIVERQTGEGAAFVTGVVDLTVGDDANVLWVLVQEQAVDTDQLTQMKFRLGKNARLTLAILNAGGRLVRHEIRGVLEGEGGDFQMRCVNLLGGESHVDVTMVLDHIVPNTTGTEIVRNIATGKASGVFQGQIRVAKEAQKTDARMACNTLLVSDEADFSAKPELEIFADDVACGHGATVAEIDEAHLFYLMSRGIPENRARALLVKAFVAEILEELDHEAISEALVSKVDDWFSKNG